MEQFVLSIDPGREKCGMAVVSSAFAAIVKAIVLPDLVAMQARDWLQQYPCPVLVLGDSTGSQKIADGLHDVVQQYRLTIVYVDEFRSSDEARRRYWCDHPPRGFRRLLPVGMLIPPEPYDDYAAVVLAERYWTAGPAN